MIAHISIVNNEHYKQKNFDKAVTLNRIGASNVMPDFILRSTPTYKWLKDPSNCSIDRKRIATFTIVCRIGYIFASDVHKIRVSNVSCLLYLSHRLHYGLDYSW
jgi:hypothetical protein